MKVFDEKLSVRETEKLVKHIVEPPKKKAEKVNKCGRCNIRKPRGENRGIVGTRVFITERKKNNKGKIEIEYYSRDELERIIELFESIR